MDTLVFLIDFKNAYPSLIIDILIKILKINKFPNDMILWIKRIYKNQRLSICTQFGLTDDFEINKGIIQGDPLSPILFDIYINHIIYNINNKFQQKNNGYDVINFYADDSIIIINNNKLQNQISNYIQKESNIINLKINFKKSLFLGRRYLNKKIINIKKKNKFTKLNHDENFTYLGQILNLNCNNTANSNAVLQQITNKLEILNVNNIHPKFLKNILLTYINSIINYHARNNNIKWITLNLINKKIAKFIRKKLFFDFRTSKSVIFNKNDLNFISAQETFIKNSLRGIIDNNNCQYNFDKRQFINTDEKKLMKNLNVKLEIKKKKNYTKKFENFNLSNNMENIIYTDGSYRKEIEEGSIGMLYLNDNLERAFRVVIENNYYAEILAIIISLIGIKTPNRIKIVTDSKSTIDGYNNWFKKMLMFL